MAAGAICVDQFHSDINNEYSAQLWGATQSVAFQTRAAHSALLALRALGMELQWLLFIVRRITVDDLWHGVWRSKCKVIM